ncbi:lipocalin family protein [Algoriphagus aestuariicola]|uniref:Lipocalin family protein n=1 Tax=Algoriphagus aestuariicola TaxID=1852016 RepID=A0ABS3BPT9_9BACT|nr:lipocalin family protein [Algoriphagus aestuariicola]MBN7801173.1 lipocalin family protein [Algoriphagus aestuariicola]
MNKQQKKPRVLPTIALILVFAVSCAADPEKVILNKWEMVSINQKENPSKEPVFWDFRNDGVVEMNAGPGKVIFANYAFEDSVRYISMSPINGGFPSRFKIEKLTSDEMILVVKEMFSRDTIYFER